MGSSMKTWDRISVMKKDLNMIGVNLLFSNTFKLVKNIHRRETNYQRQASVESIRGPRSEEVGYREGYREVEESMGYNSGFNPHMKHSVEPLQASQPGYLGGYAEVSGLPGQRLSTASLASSTPSYQSSSTSRLGQGVPPPPAAFASPPGSSYSPSPRSSYRSRGSTCHLDGRLHDQPSVPT